jgi:GntR family transcriptional regulator
MGGREQARRGEQPYLVIARELREAILRGDPGYRADDKLPSIKDLSLKYQRNHVTVGRAYGVLVAEGLVIPYPKIGYFVRTYPMLTYRMTDYSDPARLRLVPEDGWMADIEAAGLHGRQEIRVEVALGDRRIGRRTLGEWLGLGDGEVAFARRRTRYISADPKRPGAPESLSDSYYRHGLVKDTAITSPESVNTAKILTALGYPQVRLIHIMVARVPTEEENRLLRLPPGTPVMERISLARTATDVPVYLQNVVTAGNGTEHQFEIQYTDPGEA